MPGSFFSKKADPIYSHVKTQKPAKGVHPLFNDMKGRQAMEKAEYLRYLRMKEMQQKYYHGPTHFDSLKLLGSPNDGEYLDSFMSMPRQRRPNVNESKDARSKLRSIAKSTPTLFGKENPQKGNLPTSQAAVSLAMLKSLRNAPKEDNIYESVEMIHYLKTKQSLDLQLKTRYVQKTGHSLFDHLRVEQALKGPSIKPQQRRSANLERPYAVSGHRSREYVQTSDGNSPSHSSSSSGDEYESFYKSSSKTPSKNSRYSHISEYDNYNMKPKQTMSRQPDSVGSESDEDWLIPRPSFMKGMMGARRSRPEQSPPSSSSGADESDSSNKSTGLR